jgi:hypothetical protein
MASADANRAVSRADALESEVRRLEMICEALWLLLQEKTGLNDAALIEKIALLDAADGKLDGQKDKEAPTECPRCGRTLPRRKPTCMCCGEMVVRGPFQP